MSAAPLPEPKPSEKFLAFAKKVLSVPKKEIDRRDTEYKAGRATAKSQAKAAH